LPGILFSRVIPQAEDKLQPIIRQEPKTKIRQNSRKFCAIVTKEPAKHEKRRNKSKKVVSGCLQTQMGVFARLAMERAKISDKRGNFP
jgi:hypothetical protein